MKTPRGASQGATEAYDLRRLIVGISGALASSTACAHSQLLHGLGITTHLMMSKSVGVTLAYELSNPPACKSLLRSITSLATSTWGRYVKGRCPRLDSPFWLFSVCYGEAQHSPPSS
jgi:hypothetical protein